MNFLQETIFFENSLQSYLISIILFIALFFIIKYFKLAFIKKLKKISEKTSNKLDDLMIEIFEKIPNFILWFISFYISILVLTLPASIDNLIGNVLLVLIVFQSVVIAKKILHFFIEKAVEKKDKSVKTAYRAIERFAAFTFWIIAGLFVLSNFGVNITALAAGLGIGGLAIAFAFKEILRDLFSYIVILLDKPIEEGDFVTVGGQTGTVKAIGIKTTRLKSVDGEEIIISNDQITSGELRNYANAGYRRVRFIVGVAYDTPIPKLKKIKIEIQKIIESFKDNEFKNISLYNLGDSAIEFDIIFHINTRNYDLYLETKDKLNFKILEYFAKSKVEIPFPSRTIYMKK